MALILAKSGPLATMVGHGAPAVVNMTNGKSLGNYRESSVVVHSRGLGDSVYSGGFIPATWGASLPLRCYYRRQPYNNLLILAYC